MSEPVRHDLELVLATGRGRVATPDIWTSKDALAIAKQLRLIAKLITLQAKVMLVDEERKRASLDDLPPAVKLPRARIKLREDV